MSPSPSLGKPLSPRARALLARASRDRALRSPAVVAGRLRRTGQPVFDLALAFQAAFGGTAWTPEGYDNALGLWLRAPPPRPDRSIQPGVPFVRIGSVRGDGDSVCYLDERGEVWNSYGGRSGTFSAYLEQAALREALDRPDDTLEVTVRPPLGEPLARALGLSPAPEATDDYQTWWTSPSIDLCHFLPAHPPVDFTHSDLLLASRLEDAVHVLEVATSLRPGIGFGLARRPGVLHETPAPGHPDRAPDPAAWSSVHGAHRFPMRSRWDDVQGVLWVIGSGQELRVEDYRLAQDGSVLEWTTYTPDHTRARSYLGAR